MTYNRPDRPLLGAIASTFVRHGKRALVEKALFSLQSEHKEQQLFDLTYASPSVSLRSKRKAGIVYKLPAPISPKSSRSYALRWLRSSVRIRKERGFAQRLLSEFRDLRSKRGETFRRRQATHQTALLNRGFLRLLRRLIQ